MTRGAAPNAQRETRGSVGKRGASRSMPTVGRTPMWHAVIISPLAESIAPTSMSRPKLGFPETAETSGIWRIGGRAGRRGAKVRKPRRKGGFGGVRPFCRGSVGRRQFQRGSAGFRSGPFGPMAFLLYPVSRPPAITRRFETAETLGIGEWGCAGWWGERCDMARSRKNGLEGVIPPGGVPLASARFLEAPPVSAATHFPVFP